LKENENPTVVSKKIAPEKTRKNMNLDEQLSNEKRGES